MGCITVAYIEPQEPKVVMIISSHILSPPSKPTPLQITSTAFKAEGVCLGPQKLKVLKALITEWDEQRTKAMEDDDWCGLLDHT